MAEKKYKLVASVLFKEQARTRGRELRRRGKKYRIIPKRSGRGYLVYEYLGI